MNEERRKILDMLAQGKITVDEAEKLLSAISQSSSESAEGEKTERKALPKYLRVVVEPGPKSASEEKVNIRVPFQLLRAGIKLASVVPVDVQGKVDEALKDKGVNIDLSKITPDNIEEVLEHLRELTVDVDSIEEKVRIFCE
jgi:DNA-directed RNA polymerase subunit F